MRYFNLIVFTFLIFQRVSWGESFKLTLENFANHYDTNRIIEPTSPILGADLVQKLKDSEEHPQDIYQDILNENPDIVTKLQTSVHSYLLTMEPGLKNYCSQNKIVARYDNLTMVEHAAIPNEVLSPLRNDYLDNMLTSLEIPNLESSVTKLANRYQEQKYNCTSVNKLKRIELKLEKICLGMNFCINARKLNSILSSAEAAYPRVQYSINGFTKYVYGELLSHENLEELLKSVYDKQLEWITLFDSGTVNKNFIPFIIEELSKQHHIKSIFLAMAYSMRNMPSLDTEYAQYPKKSLLLETYFWRFKDIRNKLSAKKYVSFAFSYYVEKSPGFYHYLTAALLSCEARLVGNDHFTSLMLGLFSKLGYKGDKFIKAFNKGKYKNEGMSYVRKLLKKQGFKAGVETGYEAGKYGSRVCGKYVKKVKKEHKRERRRLRNTFKEEVTEIEESFAQRKREVFNSYVKEKRRIEYALRKEQRASTYHITSISRSRSRASLRENKINYFYEIEEINKLIDAEIDKLDHQSQSDNLVEQQNDEVMAVDLSRSY